MDPSLLSSTIKKRRTTANNVDSNPFYRMSLVSGIPPPPSAIRASQQQLYGRASSISCRPSNLPSSGLSVERPSFRNKNWQQTAIKEIIEALESWNYPNSISIKTLQSPSTKDFQSIFKFLYERIDPSIKWESNSRFDDLLLALLQGMRCPFVPEIRKQTLAAVGSMHSWPILLGMLKWLQETASYWIYLSNEYQKVDIEEEKTLDQHYFDYLAEAYKIFLEGDDDFSELDQALRNIAGRQSGETLFEIEELKNSKYELEQEMDELLTSESPLIKAQKDYETLKVDKEKFIQYHSYCENKKEKILATLQQLSEKVQQEEKEISALREEKENLQTIVDNQPISTDEVQRMVQNREQIHNNLQQITAKKRELASKIEEDENDLSAEMAMVDEMVRQFNTAASRINLISSNGEKAQIKNDEFNVDINFEDSGKAISSNLEELRRNVLMKFRKETNSRHNNALQDKYEQERKLDHLIDGITNQRSSILSIEKNIAALNQQVEEAKKESNENNAKREAFLHETEKTIAEMRLKGNKNVMEMREKRQAAQIRCDRMDKDFREHLDRTTKEYNKKVEDYLRYEQILFQSLVEFTNISDQSLQETKATLQELELC
ncbi:hypothetical protein G9A89_004209 [Geosiphon pyriformis]|nr:hypothetical protein G9A89_004209 [Geosiphon pyriformis]